MAHFTLPAAGIKQAALGAQPLLHIPVLYLAARLMQTLSLVGKWRAKSVLCCADKKVIPNGEHFLVICRKSRQCDGIYPSRNVFLDGLFRVVMWPGNKIAWPRLLLLLETRKEIPQACRRDMIKLVSLVPSCSSSKRGRKLCCELVKLCYLLKESFLWCQAEFWAWRRWMHLSQKPPYLAHSGSSSCFFPN